MKKLIGLFVFIATVALADDYRTFTSTDGRTLEAKIIRFDSATGKVMIERKDRKRITVAATAFSEQDQTYIENWNVADAFMSPSKFKLEIQREEVGSTKKEHEVDVGDEFSGGGGRRGGGGDTGVIIVATDKITKYKYILSMENKSGVPLKNVIMEYRIYYEQQKAIKDEKANKGRAEDDTRPERYMAVDQQKAKEGQKRLKPLEPKKPATISTDTITLTKRSANRTWGDKIDLKAELSGAWIQLSMRGPNGEKLVRDIASPESVMKKFPWDVPEQPEEEPAEAAKEDEPKEKPEED
ncbi:hypothetical protein PDESU_02773 [Pontiella desulfatans]|uniref:SLA1 homology domain-containing protein n=1 Tax=Pontiella desulfatans TaxID=2750659 RepID=A0A6C2U3M1_PONDE|nr:hypothetical protein [Pontiella desulfatans]VGO14214.1 hypothetical protein PDESU_02773 [Pontiella desulfatans]